MHTHNSDPHTLNRVRLQNEQRLIQQEINDLQIFLLEGINPGHLRVHSAIDALSRIRDLGTAHANLSIKINKLPPPDFYFDTIPTEAALAAS